MTATKTKPAPPPPKHTGELPPRQERVTSYQQLEHFELPLREPALPEWKAVLRDAGYPSTVVVIDFENYFDADYNMRKDAYSTIEYVMDEKFENLGVSVAEIVAPFDDYEQKANFWAGEQGVRDILAHLQRQYGENLEKCTVVAHNALFEGTILSFHYGITPPYVVDTLGLARHWNSRTRNDLDSLCKRWGLPVKGDTGEFKGWTFRKRRKKRKKNEKGPPKLIPRIRDEDTPALAEYANNDVVREFELFALLMAKLSCPTTELKVMQHTLRLFWEPWLEVDPDKGATIREQMYAEMSKACEAAGLTQEEASKDSKFEPIMEAALTWADDDPVKYRKAAKNKQGYKLAIAKDDPEREWLENHEDEKVRKLIAARNAVNSWPLHIKRVNRIIRQAQAAGGYLPVPLKYHGAHTGRWSGGEKINLQNLGSRGHELVSAIRELLVAPEGYELVIADASQIEARVLAWLAGQDDLIEQFRQYDAGEAKDVYCYMADDIVGHKVRKPKDSDPKRIADRMERDRYKGKVAVLGGGYGMGKNKFADSYGLPLEEAETIVQVYRQKNRKIVQLWKDIEKAFKYTFKYNRPCQICDGQVRFDQTDDCDIIMTLPSGREVKYGTVQVKPDDWGESIRVWNNQEKKWVHIWGGHLTENLVQAVSRDILWEAVDQMESSGHHIALHVHDELIAVVPEGHGNKVLNKAIKFLSDNPSWATGCPLAAEGVVSSRYGGH